MSSGNAGIIGQILQTPFFDLDVVDDAKIGINLGKITATPPSPLIIFCKATADDFPNPEHPLTF